MKGAMKEYESAMKEYERIMVIVKVSRTCYHLKVGFPIILILIFFDCDGRFEKMESKNVLDLYEDWLDESINTLKRIEKKLHEMTLQEVIDSERDIKNFSINAMILRLMDAEPLKGGHSGDDLKRHLEREYKNWKDRTDKIRN